jgi:NADH:ubiquinone oxidoreductase subunit E
MESLIHHFKIVTEGYRVPEGEVYEPVESPRASSAATSSRTAARSRGASSSGALFVALEATATCMRDALVADMIAIVGSLDTVSGRGRSLRGFYGRGPGRSRAVPGRALGDACRRCGSRRSEHGWLPPEAFREVADALELTPATATRSPRSTTCTTSRRRAAPVEVCTNLSCALVGAQRVVEAFEASSASARGDDRDGEITFRTVECLGGCGYATVVAVDHRYRQHVRPEDVAAIVEGARAARSIAARRPTSAT